LLLFVSAPQNFLMSEIQLGYGRGTQTFNFDDARFQVLETNPADEKPERRPRRGVVPQCVRHRGPPT